MANSNEEVYRRSMNSGGILDGSPYLLDDQHAATLMAHSTDLTQQVVLLRKNGALDDATLEALRKEWNVEQVYESAGIEGNQLSLNETRLAISRGITISGKPPEHTDEVVRLHEAHEYLEELIKDRGPITQTQLLDIHALVLGRGTPGAGEYRKVEVAIGNQAHKPPHPLKVPEMMDGYFRWLTAAQGNCPVPLQAAVAHAWLAHIHPFRDGNGRTARAVMNLLLMRAGFPIVIIRRKDRQRYYDSLARSDEGDIGPVLELVVARARDSTRQIDRVRQAATGVSIEMERIAAADDSEVAVWNAAVGLFCEELAVAFQKIAETDRNFNFDWRRYEALDREDYRQLCQRHTISQSWIARYRLSRGAKSFQVLLWAGFASDEMGRTATARPALFLSEPNPDGFPQWRKPTSAFATSLREIAYVDGRFMARREGQQPSIEESVTAFMLKLVQEILRNAFN